MGRKKVDRIIVDKNLFFEILKRNNLSIRSLGKSLSSINEKTIRRGLSEGFSIRSLNILARALNVDPLYLTERKQREITQELEKIGIVEGQQNTPDWRTPPYNSIQIFQRKLSDPQVERNLFDNLLIKYGVNVPELGKVAPELKSALESDMAVLIKAIIIKKLHGFKEILPNYHSLEQDTESVIDDFFTCDQYKKVKDRMKRTKL